MSIRKRVLLIVLCLIVVALPIAAAGNSPWSDDTTCRGRATLLPIGNSDEPNASGVAKASCTSGYVAGGWTTWGTLTVSCTGLTPGATYMIYPYGIGEADKGGKLTVRCSWHPFGGYPPQWLSVLRLDPPPAMVTVLSGSMVWGHAK